MNIGIIGATGNIGQRVLTEALSRGHHVTAFTRDPSRIPEDRRAVSWRQVDVLDAGSLVGALSGLDVLISLFQPGNAARDLNDTLERSISHPEVYAMAARALLNALGTHPRTRLIVVGGAGSLERSPGVTLADSPEALRAGLKALGLPEAYEVAVRGHRDALNVLRLSNRFWTYLSPAEHIYPGERTGRFRLGGDQPVVDAQGRSHISFEDCAVALIDEAELPRHVQRRFTLGY
ncbi:hypothetical protein MFU01_23770 [Myxococcus fulvus]|nr:NAD(P)H-binding protein [Myxococcus fulvus]GEN07340.1 hypothetical protein MFU01_23770 [Myxococcus fulvus]